MVEIRPTNLLILVFRKFGLLMEKSGDLLNKKDSKDPKGSTHQEPGFESQKFKNRKSVLLFRSEVHSPK